MLSASPSGTMISMWNVPGHSQPSMTSLASLETAALVWYDDWVQDHEADFENWSRNELKALVLVLKDEINILRNLHGLPDRTNQQLKYAIKSKL